MKELRIIVFLSMVLALAGCQSSGPWAPDEPKVRKNRLAYYETNHWPYAEDFPPVKVPAQFAAGMPALPCVLAISPFTFFSSDNPTYDFGLAFIAAERLYMEYPGYALYRAVGYPLHLLQEGSLASYWYCYGLFVEEETAAQPPAEATEEAAEADSETKDSPTEQDVEKEDAAPVEVDKDENPGTSETIPPGEGH